MRTKTFESEILDRGSEEFTNDSDVLDVLDMFYRGFYSKEETIDRLTYLRECADQRALRAVEQGDDGGDDLRKQEQEDAHFGGDAA